MFILKDIDAEEGVWHPFEYREKTIRLKIRPLPETTYGEMRSRHKKVTRERDPQTRQMVAVTAYDEDAIAGDMIDHCLEDFEGFCDKDLQPLPPTRENKARIMSIPRVRKEQTIAEFVFETSREMVVELAREREESVKNL